MTEPLPDVVREVDDPMIKVLVVHIDDLRRELQVERELHAYWKHRAEQSDQRVADLETERFTR